MDEVAWSLVLDRVARTEDNLEKLEQSTYENRTAIVSHEKECVQRYEHLRFQLRWVIGIAAAGLVMEFGKVMGISELIKALIIQ